MLHPAVIGDSPAAWEQIYLSPCFCAWGWVSGCLEGDNRGWCFYLASPDLIIIPTRPYLFYFPLIMAHLFKLNIISLHPVHLIIIKMRRSFKIPPSLAFHPPPPPIIWISKDRDHHGVISSHFHGNYVNSTVV